MGHWSEVQIWQDENSYDVGDTVETADGTEFVVEGSSVIDGYTVYQLKAEDGTTQRLSYETRELLPSAEPE